MTNLCIAEYMKNIKRNLIICILLAASIVLVLLTMGNIKTTYKYYAAIKPYLGDNGQCSMDVITSDKMILSKKLDGMEGVESYKIFGVTYMTVENGSKNVYLYDEEDSKTLMPALAEGKWEESNPEDTTTINVLVSENHAGIKTGDIIDTECFFNDGQILPIKAKVVGIFKNGERISGYMQFTSMFDISYKTFYSVFDLEQNEDYIFVSTEKEYSKLGEIFMSSSNVGIIKYKDELSEEAIQQTDNEITSYFNEQGSMKLGSVKLNMVKENSSREIKKLVLQFLPFAIVVMILSIICIISASAVAALEGLYSYTVYYVTGMKWSGVLKICGFSTLCNELMSGILSIIAITVIHIKLPNIASRIHIGVSEIGIILGIWIVMFVLSILMPLSILKNNKPAQLLQQKG